MYKEECARLLSLLVSRSLSSIMSPPVPFLYRSFKAHYKFSLLCPPPTSQIERLFEYHMVLIISHDPSLSKWSSFSSSAARGSLKSETTSTSWYYERRHTIVCIVRLHGIWNAISQEAPAVVSYKLHSKILVSKTHIYNWYFPLGLGQTLLASVQPSFSYPY